MDLRHVKEIADMMDDVHIQAVWELNLELFEAAVEREKERLRHKRPFWHRIFPFKLIIVKR